VFAAINDAGFPQIPVRTVRRWTPDRREHELARLRAEQAEIQRAERAAFVAGLADLHLDAEPRP
jgi:hypothetical protein